MTDTLLRTALIVSDTPELMLAAKVTVVLAFGLLAASLARRAAASVRALVLASTFAAVALLPLVAWLVPSLTVPLASSVARVAADEAAPVPILHAIERHETREAVALDDADTARFPLPTVDIASVLRAVWILGMLAVLMPLVMMLWRLRALRLAAERWHDGEAVAGRVATAAGVRRTIAVLRHDAIRVPMTCGIIRPALLLPWDAPTWSRADLERAFVHEIEHVRRGDWAVLLLAHLVCAAYWFHPLVWHARRQLHLFAERACDDAVIGCGESGRYAAQLVQMAERLSARESHPLPAMASRHDLPVRVTAVLDDRQARHRTSKRAAATAICAVVLGLAFVAPLTAGRARPPDYLHASGAQLAEGQTPVIGDDRFEVSSVRENRSGSTGRRIQQHPSGLNATNVTVLQLIEYAFDVVERDVVGDLPGWVRTAHFDVTARSEDGPLTYHRLRAMTRALIEDRFRLDVSYEPAVGRVYALVTARTDGRTGPRLRPSESDCDASVRAPLEGPQRSLDFSGTCGMGTAFSPDGALIAVFGQRVTMREIARQLSRVRSFDRPVVDRTGLNGDFDLGVVATSDIVAATGDARFHVALREQAGLELRTEQGVFEVLRVRHIEQPSPN